MYLLENYMYDAKVYGVCMHTCVKGWGDRRVRGLVSKWVGE